MVRETSIWYSNKLKFIYFFKDMYAIMCKESLHKHIYIYIYNSGLTDPQETNSSILKGNTFILKEALLTILPKL